MIRLPMPCHWPPRGHAPRTHAALHGHAPTHAWPCSTGNQRYHKLCIFEPPCIICIYVYGWCRFVSKSAWPCTWPCNYDNFITHLIPFIIVFDCHDQCNYCLTFSHIPYSLLFTPFNRASIVHEYLFSLSPIQFSFCMLCLQCCYLTWFTTKIIVHCIQTSLQYCKLNVLTYTHSQQITTNTCLVVTLTYL